MILIRCYYLVSEKGVKYQNYNLGDKNLNKDFFCSKGEGVTGALKKLCSGFQGFGGFQQFSHILGVIHK